MTESTSQFTNFATNPWIVKHKPKTLDDVYEHSRVVKKLKAMVRSKLYSHIYMIGPSGSGKKTIIQAFLNSLHIHPSNSLWIHQTWTKSVDLKSRILNFLTEKKNDVHNWIIIQNAHKLPYYSQSLLYNLFSYPNLTLVFIDVKNNSLDTQWWNHWCIRLTLSQRTYQECTLIARKILEKENITRKKINIDSIITASQQNFYCFIYMLQFASLGHPTLFKYLNQSANSFPSHEMLYHASLSHKIQMIDEFVNQGYSHHDIAIHLYNYVKSCEHSVEDLIDIGKAIQTYSFYDHDPYTLLAAIATIHLRHCKSDSPQLFTTSVAEK